MTSDDHYAAVTRVTEHGMDRWRPTRVSVGGGMVKPVRPLAIRDRHGRVIETLSPERSRLNPFHEIVRQAPLLFRAADMGDTKTRAALVDIQERYVRHRSGRRRASTPDGSWALANKPPRPRRSSWQL